MPVKWIEYKGHKILCADYSNQMDNKKLLSILNEFKYIISEQKSPILAISNYKNMYFFDEFMNKINIYSVEYKDKIKKMAIIGIDGLKKMIIKTYFSFKGEKNINLFSTEEDAKEWLISNE